MTATEEEVVCMICGKPMPEAYPGSWCVWGGESKVLIPIHPGNCWCEATDPLGYDFYSLKHHQLIVAIIQAREKHRALT